MTVRMCSIFYTSSFWTVLLNVLVSGLSRTQSILFWHSHKIHGALLDNQNEQIYEFWHCHLRDGKLPVNNGSFPCLIARPMTGIDLDLYFLQKWRVVEFLALCMACIASSLIMYYLGSKFPWFVLILFLCMSLVVTLTYLLVFSNFCRCARSVSFQLDECIVLGYFSYKPFLFPSHERDYLYVSSGVTERLRNSNLYIIES